MITTGTGSKRGHWMIRILLITGWFLGWEVNSAAAQNFQPPFPRIGVIYFYEANIPEEIWKNHDLIVVRLWYPEIARKIKAKYPEKIVLATNNVIDGTAINPPDDYLIPTLDGSCIKGWHQKHPGDCLYDGTNFCPIVNGKRWNDFLTDFLAERTDWSVFDGTFWDSWAGSISWQESYDQVDFNRNGIADNREQKDLADKYWREGNRLIVEKLRQKTPPGKVVVAHEASAEEVGYLNGLGDEDWEGNSWEWFYPNVWRRFQKEAVTPRVNFIEARGKPEDFQRMRFGLTTACLLDAFFTMDEGNYAHRYTYIYDEYFANLGYPTSEAEEIRKGVYVRYFDNGAVVVNASGKPQTITASDLRGGPYYRFLGGQVPDFNNGEKLGSIRLEGSISGRKQTGDGVLLFKQPTVLIAPIIVDNVAINMTSPGNQPARLEGNWIQQDQGKLRNTNAYALNYGWDEYGAPYAYTHAGNGESRAIYTPTIGVAGEYDVYEWHPFHGNAEDDYIEAQAVPYVIKHARGTTTGTIDQSKNSGRWNYLGRFYFEKGTSGYIMISNNVSSGIVLADAFKFVYAATNNDTFSADRTPPKAPTGVKIEKN